VEAGESFVAAAERETLEEGGIPVRIEGIIRVEHSPRHDSARVRVIFFARPLDETAPKTVADGESLGAAWIGVDELSNYSLRGEEVRDLCKYVLAGCTIYPLSVIQQEGMPFCTGDGEAAK